MSYRIDSSTGDSCWTILACDSSRRSSEVHGWPRRQATLTNHSQREALTFKAGYENRLNGWASKSKERSWERDPSSNGVSFRSELVLRRPTASAGLR